MQQKDYLMKISEIMKNFVSKVYTGWRKCNGKDFEYIDVRTYTHPEFTKLRQEFYPNGKKDLNEKLFRKLTGKSFAYWFFDDGSTTGYGFSITTFDKNFKDTEKFKKLFK